MPQDYQDKTNIDKTTGSLSTITYAHHEIHEGDSFSIGTYNPDLDTNAVLSVAFKTPDTAKWFHIVGIMKNTSSGLAEVLEAPTITNDSGTESTIINRNRNSTKTSTALSIEATPAAGQASINPTITADGTIISAEYIGTGKNKGVGEARALEEIILKQDTVYAFRITGAADNGDASIKLVWYEHTNR